MVTRWSSYLLLLAISLLFTACQPAPEEIGQEVSIGEGSYRVISVQELENMLEQKDFTLMNVQIPQQGDIPQTDLHLAYNLMNVSQDELPQEKEAKIIVYCKTGGYSKIAVESLVELGYINVLMLEGGITAWEEAGLSITR